MMTMAFGKTTLRENQKDVNDKVTSTTHENVEAVRKSIMQNRLMTIIGVT